jgi:hypothetical protein
LDKSDDHLKIAQRGCKEQQCDGVLKKFAEKFVEVRVEKLFRNFPISSLCLSCANAGFSSASRA